MDKKQKNRIYFWGILVIVVGGFIYLYAQDASKPGKYTDFAKCIEESGAEMYGAFWCPACERQLASFGKAKDDLPYNECSNPDRSSTQICIDENIESFPTWKFADGTVRQGVQEFEDLARLTGCQLPE